MAYHRLVQAQFNLIKTAKLRYSVKVMKHTPSTHVLTVINASSSVSQTDVNNRDDRWGRVAT